jgi:hypothetical protein
MGPYDVTVQQIQSLDIGFTPFVNRLLETEAQASGLEGHQLVINNIESLADGGVDAAIRNAIGTDWIPRGESAWQFKRSNLGPQECANELVQADAAHEILKKGGTYVLVLGKALSDTLIERRRAKLVAQAVKMKLISKHDSERIRVYDANKLARWASTFPSLAFSTLAGGPGGGAVDIESWSSSRRHSGEWVSDLSRQNVIDQIRLQVANSNEVEVRVQGESGAGKTRLVLEALSEPAYRNLVVYVHHQDSVDGDLLGHLNSSNRVAILVVDDCSATQHRKLAERLLAGPAVKLVTIGQDPGMAWRSPILAVGQMPNTELELVLRSNYPGQSIEARRFIVTNCGGNIGMALLLAERVSKMTEVQAADSIERGDIEQFFTAIIPDGRDFFLATILSLLKRVGWDRELTEELKILAKYADTSVTKMKQLGLKLEKQGILERQGRFRAISPHPIAVYLAAEAWREHATSILSGLLPNLSEEMALSMFERVADLGRFEPTKSPLAKLLATDGPFATLEGIENEGFGGLLTQLAIVLPDEVVLHVRELVEAVSKDKLYSLKKIRRDLVWTLEKLAWNSRNFEDAADVLMLLALAENENYANNATNTWVSLFGTMLPGTSAAPNQRVEYLKQIAISPDSEVRLLAIQGAKSGLTVYEFITASGEIQGGVLVEPRGTPTTYGDADEYRRQMIMVLRGLVEDSNILVSRAAEDALIGSLHSLITDNFIGEFLANVLMGLRATSLNRLRIEITGLINLHSRSKSESRGIISKLEDLNSRIPKPSAIERLRVILNQRRWDFEDGELKSQIREVLQATLPNERDLVLLLLREEFPAAWEFGQALGSILGYDEAILAELVDSFSINLPTIAGYLDELTKSGSPEAFLEFIDSGLADSLSHFEKAAIVVRGPATDRAKAHVLREVDAFSVAQGVSILHGWRQNLTEAEVHTLMNRWEKRLDSQQDYSSLVDWLNMWLYGKETIPDSLKASVIGLLVDRKKFPNVGQQIWDWCHIAQLAGVTEARHLFVFILDLIESNAIMIHPGHDDAVLFTAWVKLIPDQLWELLTERLGAGSWRIQMQIRGWFIGNFPTEIVTKWIGTDLSRAQTVASVSPAGGDEPSELARYLLEKFGDDELVASSLASEFWSGGWTGPQSDRILSQISQLNSWRHNSSEPLGVRKWAAKMIQSLEKNLQNTLEREAEDNY